MQRRVGDFSLDKVPLRDEQTLALLGRGQTLGIFQLESSLFKDLLRKLKPQSFDDIVALLALGRPGPLSMLDEFAARRRDPGRITYIHPSLEEILGETYGLILYQEQVMTIAHRLGGLSLGRPICCAVIWLRTIRRPWSRGENASSRGRWRRG